MGISFFFFNDTATTEIYTLSLHDALPICRSASRLVALLCWISFPLPCFVTRALALKENASERPQQSIHPPRHRHVDLAGLLLVLDRPQPRSRADRHRGFQPGDRQPADPRAYPEIVG